MGKIRQVARDVPGARSLHRKVRAALQDARLRSKDPQSVFTDIYEDNGWTGERSLSGPGSDADQTRAIVAALPDLLGRHPVGSVLDVPCGDFEWMRHVDLAGRRYIGGDIVEELIAADRELHGSADVRFEVLDLISDPLPTADLVLCRDCLVHLSYAHILDALQAIVASGATFLLTTTFPGRRGNSDIATGRWRPLDLEAAPFLLPAPLELIDERCTEGGGRYADKSLALWRIDDLRGPVEAMGRGLGAA